MGSFDPHPLAFARRELALTFDSTNIPGDKDQPFIKPGASIEEIEAGIDKMPAELVQELWERLNSIFPLWGGVKPKTP